MIREIIVVLSRISKLQYHLVCASMDTNATLRTLKLKQNVAFGYSSTGILNFNPEMKVSIAKSDT